MAINQYGRHGKTAVAVLGMAVAMLTACTRSPTVPPLPVEQPAVVDVAGRLVALQEAVEALSRRQLGDAEDVTTTRAAAKSAADDLERRLKALTQYVKEVERSIARIDAALSSPDLLEKKLALQKKALVNR